MCGQARIQGGGQGCLAPPPHFLGAKNHTHRKKKIKIGQPRSNIQAKTYPKTRSNFIKKILVRWGGLRGHKGKYFQKCTLKNIYNTPQICSGMLKIARKALHFLKFLGGAPPPPPRRTGHSPPPLPYLPCGVSPRLLFHKKNNFCHFYSFIISVYISNVFASLVVQF